MIKEKAARYVSAFLNTAGGILLFGVDDDGSVTGCDLDKEAREAVTKVCLIYTLCASASTLVNQSCVR